MQNDHQAPLHDTLPPYLVRRDKRAKRVKLSVCKQRGIIVTIPYRFNMKGLAQLLMPHQDWMNQHYQALQIPHIQTAPTEMVFAAMNEIWRITYVVSERRIQTFIRPDHELVLFGQVEHLDDCLLVLTNWVKQYAGAALEKTVSQLSQEIGLPFNEVVVRYQKSIWGSCTITKTINLNAKLIFLPAALMRYVLIHELCHTKYMNHAKSFWNLVGSFDPDWRQHRSQLKNADQYIPHWLQR
jgi:predicted metal-dependent hydrolase